MLLCRLCVLQRGLTARRVWDVRRVDLAGVWATVLVFDLVVFGLTVFRVLRVGKKWRGSMFTLMLKDGERLARSSLWTMHLLIPF